MLIISRDFLMPVLSLAHPTQTISVTANNLPVLIGAPSTLVLSPTMETSTSKAGHVPALSVVDPSVTLSLVVLSR